MSDQQHLAPGASGAGGRSDPSHQAMMMMTAPGSSSSGGGAGRGSSDEGSGSDVELAGDICHRTRLCEQLEQLLVTGSFSDTVLLVDGHRFKVHRAILAARSEYFRALLFSGMKESHQTEIHISGARKKPFKALLQYIYNGQLFLDELDEKTVLGLVTLSHQYGFDQLLYSLCECLQSSVCCRNVCVLYDVASLYQIDCLLATCQKFIDTNAVDVLGHSSFCDLSPASVLAIISRDSLYAPEMAIFHAVRDWIAANPTQSHTAIVDAIRLPLLSMQELVVDVRNSGVCESNSILDAIGRKLDCKNYNLPHRGLLCENENVCSMKLGTRATRGDMAFNMIDGNNTSYTMEEGFARCAIGTGSDETSCLEVMLDCCYLINHIKFLLWDRDARSYSYRVAVSEDGKDWLTVADYSKYICRSWQFIYFKTRAVRHIRLVGTHNTANRMFHVVALEAFFCSEPEQVEDSIIVPQCNVARLGRSAVVIEGVSRNRHALINGDIVNYDWDHGYTCHQLGGGAIIVQFGQPVLVDSMGLLLWDCDDRSYSYYVEVSADQRHWEKVCDRSDSECRSWQLITFPRRIVVLVRIVGTRNTVNEVFHCVHFECPARRFGPTALNLLGELEESTELGAVGQAGLATEEGHSQRVAANRRADLSDEA